MKILRFLFAFLIFTFSMNGVQAQEVWSLEKCIQHAIDNNLNIKQSQLQHEGALLTEKLNRSARYPSLSASSNFGYQFGRTIDPISNSFSLDALASQTIGLNASANLYNGGRINNSIEQGKLDAMAAREDLMQSKNDIALTVATAYINVLFAKERMLNAEQRLDLTMIQKTQTEKLIKAGALPANDVLEFEAQAALNEQEIIIQQNAHSLASLNLKQLLQLSPSQDIEVVVPSIEVDNNTEIDSWNLEDVYNKAVAQQPFIKAGQYRLQSAELQEKIVRADKLPRLTVFGGIDTRFSDQVPEFGPSSDIIVENEVFVNGIPTTIGQTVTVPGAKLGTLPYFDQLSDNLGQNLGLSLNIPIYSNNRVNIAEDRAALNVLSTKITNEQQDQKLKTDIQQAITDAKAARLQWVAANKTLSATKASFENTEKKFKLGAANSLDLSIAKNRLDSAQIDLIVAKYQYIFNSKVVDYYKGIPLSL